MRSKWLVALGLVAISVVLCVGSWSSGAASAERPSHPAVAPAAATAVQPYSNDFETNTAGWCDQAPFPCNGQPNQSGTIDRVPSGFSNYGVYAAFVASEAGQWHAVVAGAANPPAGTNDTCVGKSGSSPCTGPYTEWGSNGSDARFPSAGFSTSLDIYLDTTWAAIHPDGRFDWDSALNDSTGNYMQDYVFNAGSSPTPGTAAFVIGSSTNADRDNTFPSNPCPGPSSPPNSCRAPVTITTSAWYRFTHVFSDDGTGHLAVELKITNASTGSAVPGADWTIRPGQALSAVGGPALGWFPNEEIYGLPIDNARLLLTAPAVGPMIVNGMITSLSPGAWTLTASVGGVPCPGASVTGSAPSGGMASFNGLTLASSCGTAGQNVVLSVNGSPSLLVISRSSCLSFQPGTTVNNVTVIDHSPPGNC